MWCQLHDNCITQVLKVSGTGLKILLDTCKMFFKLVERYLPYVTHVTHSTTLICRVPTSRTYKVRSTYKT